MWAEAIINNSPSPLKDIYLDAYFKENCLIALPWLNDGYVPTSLNKFAKSMQDKMHLLIMQPQDCQYL